MRTVPRPAGDFVHAPGVGIVVPRLTPPPAPAPRLVRDDGGTLARDSIIGERVMVARDTSWLVDVRALSEPYRGDAGLWWVDYCDEAAWYAAGCDPEKVPAQQRWTALAREVWTD